jgi:chemotaxis protein CheD
MSAPSKTSTGRIPVGIGQLSVSKDTDASLVAYGLGSCIGVSAYDPVAQVGGLIHILLPCADGKRVVSDEPARFADTGLAAFVEELKAEGAQKSRLIIKYAGGASVLGKDNAEKFKIGVRNAEAVQEQLSKQGLRTAAQDTGGDKGRTMEIQVGSGKTLVRLAASPAKEL